MGQVSEEDYYPEHHSPTIKIRCHLGDCMRSYSITIGPAIRRPVSQTYAAGVDVLSTAFAMHPLPLLCRYSQ
jgi:hypothetical protein